MTGFARNPPSPPFIKGGLGGFLRLTGFEGLKGLIPPDLSGNHDS